MSGGSSKADVARRSPAPWLTAGVSRVFPNAGSTSGAEAAPTASQPSIPRAACLFKVAARASSTLPGILRFTAATSPESAPPRQLSAAATVSCSGLVLLAGFEGTAATFEPKIPTGSGRLRVIRRRLGRGDPRSPSSSTRRPSTVTSPLTPAACCTGVLPAVALHTAGPHEACATPQRVHASSKRSATRAATAGAGGACPGSSCSPGAPAAPG